MKKALSLIPYFLLSALLLISSARGQYVSSPSYRIYLYRTNATIVQSDEYGIGSGTLAPPGAIKPGENVTAAKGDSCKVFDSVSDVPADWFIVRSCDRWYSMKEANQTLTEIKTVPKNVSGEAAQLLEKAKQEYEEVNYSGAKKLAQKALEEMQEPKLPLPLYILIPVIIGVSVGGGVGGFFLYKRFRGRGGKREVGDLNREIADLLRQIQGRVYRRGRGWRTYQRLNELYRESRELLRNYERLGSNRASSRLERLKSDFENMRPKVVRMFDVKGPRKKYKEATKLERFRIKMELKLSRSMRSLKAKIGGVIDKIKSIFS